MTWAEPLYTAAEMREAESAYDGPTLDLMERAGEAVAQAALRRFGAARRVAVWCGTGANGGDGFVTARHLRAAGREVRVVLVGDEARIGGDAAESLRRARDSGLGLEREAGDAELVVDALFGTGFTGKPRREAAQAIAAIGAAGAPVLAVDVPSGVDASTGETAGEAVRAAVTVTFHGRKVGLAVAPGRFHAGDVEVADIGIPTTETAIARVRPEVLDLVPRRSSEQNKYSAGTVLVVGGSAGLTGAPCLAAEAAMRAGAGYVFVGFPAALAPVFELRLLEAVKRPLPDGGSGHLQPDAADAIVELAVRAQAVALGPGIGRDEGTIELVRILLERIERPIVVDADALFALAGHLDWVFTRHAPTVLTPHSGELGRLIRKESRRVDARRLVAAQTGADETGSVLLLKGADTIVAAPGRGPLVSDLGTPGLATAGSGDVLTGIVAAFLAKGMEPRLAAAAAAVAQGVAAREAARDTGYAGMIASDVVPSLSRILS